jgi:hypothetical protein
MPTYRAPGQVLTGQSGRRIDATLPTQLGPTRAQGKRAQGYVPKPQATGQVFPKKAN